MDVSRAYKVEISPSKEQVLLFWKAFGTRRYIYNRMLHECKEYYDKNKKSYPRNELKRHLTVVKQEHKDWMYEVPKSVHQNALEDLNSAFDRFFKIKGSGYPTFKSKYKSSNSFTMDNDRFKITPHGIQFQVFGFVKFKQNNYIPRKKNTKYSYATVSYNGGKYYVSVSMKKDIPSVTLTDDVIGVDVGVKTLAVCSNGMTFENPKSYRKGMKKLRRLSKSVSRKKKVNGSKGLEWSKNRQKAKFALAKHHAKVANIRKDAIHKMTTALVKAKPKVIVIEDLNVKGMVKNRKLSQSISDAAFGEIKRQLVYKAEAFGIEVFFADRFFPSSKTCNRCGTIKDDLTLSDRIYKCDCGYVEDRDMNAALNLKRYYIERCGGP